MRYAPFNLVCRMRYVLAPNVPAVLHFNQMERYLMGPQHLGFPAVAGEDDHLAAIGFRKPF